MNKRGNQGVAWANFAVQLFVGIVLFATVLVVCENVVQQGKFNRNSLRPWLSISQKVSCIITDSIMDLEHIITCSGGSPAHNIRSLRGLSNNIEIELDLLKKTTELMAEKYSFMVPGQQYEVGAPLNYKKFAPNKGKFIERLLRKELFVHLYYKYTDFDSISHYYYVVMSLYSIDTIADICAFQIERAQSE